MTVYKIRDKETGLFSRGGAACLYPIGWGKRGKIWSALSFVMAHLDMYLQYQESRSGIAYYICKVPDTWEIIEYKDGKETVYNAKSLLLFGTKKKIA